MVEINRVVVLVYFLAASSSADWSLSKGQVTSMMVALLPSQVTISGRFRPGATETIWSTDNSSWYIALFSRSRTLSCLAVMDLYSNYSDILCEGGIITMTSATIGWIITMVAMFNEISQRAPEALWHLVITRSFLNCLGRSRSHKLVTGLHLYLHTSIRQCQTNSLREIPLSLIIFKSSAKRNLFCKCFATLPSALTSIGFNRKHNM